MNPMHQIKHACSSKTGFSLLEISVSLFIFILIGLAVYTFQKEVFSLNGILSERLTAQGEARRALKTMSAEIRTASPSSLGAYAIVETATSSFTFYSNIDDDPLKERVRYFIDGTTLKKGVIKPTGSPLTYIPANETVADMVHDVANFATSTFRYYDETYDGTTQPLADPVDKAAVRLVQVTLALDKNPQAQPGPLVLTTQVQMRNLKDNL